MKKTLLLASLLLLLNVSCTSYDDSAENTVINLNIPNLITFDQTTNYSVGDYVYFNINFSRYLPESGFTDLLDIYQTTGATRFNTSFALYRKTPYETYDYIDFGNFFITEKGEIINNNYAVAYADYNTSNDHYEFRGGIKLLEPGQYKLEVSPFINPINNFRTNPIFVYINSYPSVDIPFNTFFFEVN